MPQWLAQSKDMTLVVIADSKLAAGVNESVNCPMFSLCISPATDW